MAVVLSLTCATGTAGVVEDISSANASGRSVFVVAADGPGPGLDAARAAAQQARGLVRDSVVVEVNREDASHATAVQKLALGKVQLPQVLLVARSGLVVAHDAPTQQSGHTLAALVPAPTVLASVGAANAAGRPVFLILNDGAGPALDSAREAARQAQLLQPKAVTVELDRRDAAQADAVARFRLSAAPAPLVLVVASNGIATGAQKPGEGAAARLASLVPSRAKSEYLKQLSEQRIAVVLFTRANMTERSPLFEAASAALQQLPGKIALITVDLDDAGEARFCADLKVDPASVKPVTVLVNPKGQVLGRLDGAATTAQITKAAGKKSCCDDPNCKDCGK